MYLLNCIFSPPLHFRRRYGSGCFFAPMYFKFHLRSHCCHCGRVFSAKCFKFSVLTLFICWPYLVVAEVKILPLHGGWDKTPLRSSSFFSWVCWFFPCLCCLGCEDCFFRVYWTKNWIIPLYRSKAVSAPCCLSVSCLVFVHCCCAGRAGSRGEGKNLFLPVLLPF